MTARPATILLSLLGLLTLLFCMALFHASLSWKDRTQGRALVRQLGLSDLTLFTEARYSRHPSMADWQTPFQDHPTSLDHFPSGSLISPPRHLRRHAGLMTLREEQP